MVDDIEMRNILNVFRCCKDVKIRGKKRSYVIMEVVYSEYHFISRTKKIIFGKKVSKYSSVVAQCVNILLFGRKKCS